MDENRRKALQAELDEATIERERLEVVISYLSEKLGMDAPSPHHLSRGDGLGIRVDATGRVDPLSLVAEGEFFGLSATAAAVQVLGKVGRPNNLKTEQLMRAIRKGGVPVKNSSTLYRSLIRHSKVSRRGPGLWGLAVWYPGSPRMRKDEASREEQEEAPEKLERPDEETA